MHDLSYASPANWLDDSFTFITFHVFTVRIDYLLKWDESIVVSRSNQWSTLTMESFHKRWTTALPSMTGIMFF